MNAASHATKRLVALHGWSATLLAFLLYVVMLTGTIVVLDSEITGWSEGRADTAPVFGTRTGQLVDRFAAQVPPELHDTVFVGRGSNGTLSLFFAAPKAHPDGGRQLFGRGYLVNPNTGVLQKARVGYVSDIFGDRPERALSHFLVDLHVHLHVPGRWGLYLTGLLGVTMLVAAITGVLIHKHILRDLFTTERPGARLVSFRDRHTLAGVWSLPFAVLLSFTGAFLSFAISLGLPVVALVAFGGDQDLAIASVLGEQVDIDATPTPMSDLTLILADAETRAGGTLTAAQIHDYGTAGATVRTFHSQADGALSGTTLEYSAATGAFLKAPEIVGSAPSAGSTIAALMAPLHFGNFAGWWSRIIWVGLGGAMTYTIVSGMQLWLRRREDDATWRYGAHALSIVAWGLPIAIALTAHAFLVTQLASDPIHWTPRAFVYSCLALIGYGLATRTRPRDQITRQLGLTLGTLLLLLPVMRLQTGGLSWGEALLWGGDDVLVLDGTCLALGLFCLTALRRTPTHSPATSPAE
ncbi:MAG: PepSY-associated TM helix domain-containing protein [Pseudomonadota bacterium]